MDEYRGLVVSSACSPIFFTFVLGFICYGLFIFRPLRSKGPSDYTVAQSGLSVKMRAELDKEDCDHDFVSHAFAQTFKLRTSLLGMAFGVSQMFEQFRVLKSSTYVSHPPL